MKKKVLTTILSVLLIGSVSVIGTFAYLTDSDSNINTFTVGRVGINLDESDVDENGEYILDDDGNKVDRVKENEYHLMPGKEYIKDPMITVEEGSEESYIRMILTVKNASAVQQIIENHDLDDYADLFIGWDPETWKYVDYTFDAEENTIRFEFRYKEIVSGYNEAGEKEADELLPLFEKIKVLGEVTMEELKALSEGGFQMEITGHAIQAAGFTENTETGETAEDVAWEAFDKQMDD